MKFFLLILTASIILSCNRRTSFDGLTSPELDSLAVAFVKDARERGITVLLTSPEVVLQFGKLERVENGQCDRSSNPKVITIDSTKWQNYSARFKRYIVYHELAHCLLNRKHIEDNMLELGECRSWMREDNKQCFIDFTNTFWCQYYLNELFGIETHPSSWYQPRTTLTDLTGSKIVRQEIIDNNKHIKDSILLDSTTLWLIETRILMNKNDYGDAGLIFDDLSMQVSMRSLFPVKKVIRQEVVISQFDALGNFNGIKREQSHIFFDKKSEDVIENKLFSIKIVGQSIFYFVDRKLIHCQFTTEKKKYVEFHGCHAIFKISRQSIDKQNPVL